MKPRVSIIMTVFNSAKYLEEAIKSVLNQTFSDFEFLIINDASTDNSFEVITSFDDNRIRIVDNSRNRGVAVSSNIGLDMAGGEYIIRMDSDDISMPNRFELQLNYMEQNKEIGVLGSWVKCFGEDMPDLMWEFPLEHNEIRANQLFTPKIHHSSVIMRKSLIDKYNLRYNPLFTRTLDYEFWVNHAEKLIYANLDEVLLLYRRHPEQISTGHFGEQQKFAGEVRLRELQQLGIKPNKNEFLMHQMLSVNEFIGSADFVYKAKAWLEKLYKANELMGYYDRSEFIKILANKWIDICSSAAVKNSEIALELWSKTFYEFPLYDKATLPEKEVKLNKLNFVKEKKYNIAIFGTGRVALNLYMMLKSDFGIKGFLDNNAENQGKMIFDIPVLSIEALKKKESKDSIVIISSILGNHDKEVMRQIEKEADGTAIKVISWKDLL